MDLNACHILIAMLVCIATTMHLHLRFHKYLPMCAKERYQADRGERRPVQLCIHSLPVLGHTSDVFVRQCSKIYIRTRLWPSRMLQMQKHQQIRRFGDPNPIDDVPDQDSAPNYENTYWTLFFWPKQSWDSQGVTPICAVVASHAAPPTTDKFKNQQERYQYIFNRDLLSTKSIINESSFDEIYFQRRIWRLAPRSIFNDIYF